MNQQLSHTSQSRQLHFYPQPKYANQYTTSCVKQLIVPTGTPFVHLCPGRVEQLVVPTATLFVQLFPGRVEQLGTDDEFAFGASRLRVPRDALEDVRHDINVSPCGVAFLNSTQRGGVLPKMLSSILSTRCVSNPSTLFFLFSTTPPPPSSYIIFPLPSTYTSTYPHSFLAFLLFLFLPYSPLPLFLPHSLSPALSFSPLSPFPPLFFPFFPLSSFLPSFFLTPILISLSFSYPLSHLSISFKRKDHGETGDEEVQERRHFD